MEPAGILTLTSDFGTEDAYVGAMKGVALSVDPKLVVQDLSHAIPPQDVAAGARLLRSACGRGGRTGCCSP